MKILRKLSDGIGNQPITEGVRLILKKNITGVDTIS